MKFLSVKGVACLMAVLFCLTQSFAQSKKVILAVFAHPDDEGTVSPVLAKYASEGASVYVAVATDGRYGVSGHAHIPEGDSLAAARKQEMQCAARQLGINPPIMLGLHDQLRMYEGMDTMTLQLNTMYEKVKSLFSELRPDVVITWGPSGWTGHPDHRLVGAVVTDVFASRVWAQPANLYYPELPAGTVHNSPFPVTTVDSAYLPVKITVSKKDYMKAKTSNECHKSQYTPEQSEALQKLVWNSEKGVIYFRPFIWKGKKQTSLFN